MNASVFESAEMNDATKQSLFLGRQPVLDIGQSVLGYEFIFHPTPADQVNAPAQIAATAEVVCNAFAELSLAKALGNQRAFITVDKTFLQNDLALLLPTETVILQVDASDDPDAELISLCRELRAAGYSFAVKNIDRLTDSVRALLGIAEYAKVQARGGDVAWLSSVIAQLRVHPVRIVVDQVETQAVWDVVKTLPIDAVQGYFFAHPVLVSGRKLGAQTQNLMRLVSLLNQDADTAEIELLLKAEPGLVANLLRLTNSVGVGLPTKVTSIRQAINVLGRQQLSRWLQLLLFAKHDGGVRKNPLMQLAALRAHFMELLVQRCYPARREWQDSAFIIGLMSVMPAALEMPMADILAQISVVSEVRDALQGRAGQLGQLLELVEHYDNNNTDAAATMLANMGGRLGAQTLNVCLAEAIAWVLSLESEI